MLWVLCHMKDSSWVMCHVKDSAVSLVSHEGFQTMSCMHQQSDCSYPGHWLTLHLSKHQINPHKINLCGSHLRGSGSIPGTGRLILPACGGTDPRNPLLVYTSFLVKFSTRKDCCKLPYPLNPHSTSFLTSLVSAESPVHLSSPTICSLWNCTRNVLFEFWLQQIFVSKLCVNSLQWTLGFHV